MICSLINLEINVLGSFAVLSSVICGRENLSDWFTVQKEINYWLQHHEWLLMDTIFAQSPKEANETTAEETEEWHLEYQRR